MADGWSIGLRPRNEVDLFLWYGVYRRGCGSNLPVRLGDMNGIRN